MGMIRLLFLADTHLGLDFPLRPRIQRRRRGPEFFANFERALQPALEDRIDCVVHGGDIFYRSKVPAGLVAMAFDPLKRVADHGVPVYLVPGNHERANIPHRHLAEHPHIHIFDRPRTFLFRKNGSTLALAGFPFERHAVRHKFLPLLAETGWRSAKADAHVLCIHQALDGATVGPSGYRFRKTPDVVRIREIPAGFDAVLAGHIHRFQVLTRDLNGIPLPAPVFYPGSIERTSFAEKDEKKGYLTLEFEPHGSATPALKQWTFHQLPARPMIQLDLHASGMSADMLSAWIKSSLQELPADSIVKLKIHGNISGEAIEVLRAPVLRTLAPETMNIHAGPFDRKWF